MTGEQFKNGEEKGIRGGRDQKLAWKLNKQSKRLLLE